MSNFTVIATTEAPKALGPYSQGVQAGNLLFISGQLGLDPATGTLVSSETVRQAEQALKNRHTPSTGRERFAYPCLTAYLHP